jgi:hypothetical protein
VRLRSSRRRAVALGLAAAIVGAGFLSALGAGFAPTPVLGAPADADIPGVPLPGPVVTGLLGGEIYDHVYSIQVPARNVLVASLTGDPGTDFDLYLFDATATTIWGTNGLVAESAGPTSTETITHPSILTTTYYLDLHGFSEQEGAFRLSVSILPDLTPPQASISIVGGATAVNAPAVTLTIRATDDLSGVDVMAFSEGGITWGPWQTLESVVPWTLSGGDGLKTIGVRVRDRSGNVSAPAWVSVRLDTVPPRIIEVDPPPNTSYSGLRPTFIVKFGEGVDPETWMDQGLQVRLGSSGTPIAGVFTYDAAGWRGLFRPSSDLVAGALYAVSLGRIRDPAGNLVQPFPDWTLSPLAEGTLSIRVSPLSPAYGETITIVGTARLPAPAPITIERHYAGSSGDWTPVLTAFPGPTGDITLTETARQSADYRLHYPGGSLIAEGYSATTRVFVRPRVALIGYTAGATNAGRAGQTVRLRAQVAPALAGALVDYRLYRYDAKKRAYVLVATYSRRTDAAGRATLDWKLRSGTWQVRVATRATVELAAGLSPAYRWVVP